MDRRARNAERGQGMVEYCPDGDRRRAHRALRGESIRRRGVTSLRLLKQDHGNGRGHRRAKPRSSGMRPTHAGRKAPTSGAPFTRASPRIGRFPSPTTAAASSSSSPTPCEIGSGCCETTFPDLDGSESESCRFCQSFCSFKWGGSASDYQCMPSPTDPRKTRCGS